MSQEKVREILSHVDMSKIDLSSLQLSEKKFNELARVFHHRVVVSSLSVIFYKEDYTDQEISMAYDMLKRAVNTPEFYYYDETRKRAAQIVNTAIKDLHWDPAAPAVKGMRVTAMNDQIKKRYKEMRSLLEQAMKEGNDFVAEMDDEKMARHIAIAKKAINDGEAKLKAMQEKQEVAETSKKPNQPEPMDRTPIVEMVENQADEALHAVQEPTVTVSQKTPFWKKIFGKVH